MTLNVEYAATGVLALQLILIAGIDLRKFIIPDICNWSLAISGVFFQALQGQLVPIETVVGVILFSGCFYGVRTLHSAVRGQIGLGLGDVKFAAAAACWIDLENYPLFLATSSLTALGYVALTYRSACETGIRDTRIPFGPFLALGLFITVLSNQNTISLGF
ncbi:prepilin peptidase [Rhizobium sp. PP-CC-3G-465]|uniref:prepilin peptidase n=1 Tax=Rhizobium sp. PP-CC-3G-465 TaxID=2135648 RepID=UPI00104F779E